jgi:UDP-N-acetylglucosamine:LPS N-acetylglucosamine transferase
MGEQNGRPVLFFSRGRGRGHAVPDLAIAEELDRIAPELTVQFVSHATGAATLAEAGRLAVDLELPEDPPFLDLVIRATREIIRLQPHFVVSHEEFAALPAAKTFGLPTALVVDFFPSSGVREDSLRFADRILFIERQGIFAEPPQARGRVRYLGPIVRRMSLGRADRAACRDRLRLPAGAPVMSVIPGAWASEERAPLWGLVESALSALPEGWRLVWVAGRDREALARRAQGHPREDGIIVLAEHSPIEELIVASDVVITKANRGTTIDAASLGVPSISLSYGANPIDDAIIPRIGSNTALDARGIDGAFLARIIASSAGRTCAPSADYAAGGAAAVAEALAGAIKRMS